MKNLTVFPKTFSVVTTDDRKNKNKISQIEKQVSRILKMEPSTKKLNSEVLVVVSSTGYMVNKKLYDILDRFIKSQRKCYVYSEYSNKLREVLRIEHSGEFADNKFYGAMIHTGVGVSDYLNINEQLIEQKS